MRILIADDESIIRMGLKSMLQQIGHEVVTAVNGREALRMVERHHPELAILDIKMPFTDGLEAAKTISRTHPLPILLLTAYSDVDLIEKATDLPIHGYLVKPIQTGELTAAIAVAVKRFAEAQALNDRTRALETDLETRKLIERAKGRLMKMGLSEEEAYQAMQREARSRRKNMREIAVAILKSNADC